MVEFPSDLIAALPQGSESVARDWWSTLSDDDRRQIAGLWDERLEVKFFTPQRSEAGRQDDWEHVPDVEGGRFIPSDDARGLKEWGPGYFEHLLQHPELVLVWEPERRTFHIGCVQHPAAQQCWKVGEIPPEFTCPLDLSTCPLLSLRSSRRIRDASWPNFQAKPTNK